jgi:hypothetical protein
MLVSTPSTPERLADLARPPVVLGQPLEVVVEGVRARRGQHAGLPHAAAQPLAQGARLASRPAASVTTRSRRAPRPLDRQTDSVSNNRPYPTAACPVATARPDRAPSQCSAIAVARR